MSFRFVQNDGNGCACDMEIQFYTVKQGDTEIYNSESDSSSNTLHMNSSTSDDTTLLYFEDQDIPQDAVFCELIDQTQDDNLEMI